MKLLCLHGLGTNSKVFQYQLDALRQELKFLTAGDVTFHFLEGQFDFPPSVQDQAKFPGPYRSFLNIKPEIITETEDLLRLMPRDTETVRKQILGAIEREGPFDLLVGFCEGGTAAAMVLAEHALEHPDEPQLVEAALFFTTLRPCDIAMTHRRTFELYGEIINIPTIHVVGDKDAQCFIQEAADFRALCRQDMVTLMAHPFKHVVPRGELYARPIAQAIMTSLNQAPAKMSSSKLAFENMKERLQDYQTSWYLMVSVWIKLWKSGVYQDIVTQALVTARKHTTSPLLVLGR